MFHYESGSPKNPGESTGINVELSSREVEQWRNKDWQKIAEAERYALIHALQQGKTCYFIKGAGDLFLDHGTTAQLQAKYPDVTSESVA